MKWLLPALVLASLLAGCTGGTDRSATPRPAHVKLAITIQRAEELHNALVNYTLSCPAATGSFPHARAACRKLSSVQAMLHPPRMTSTCLGGPGIPPVVDIHGTVNTEAIDFSLTSCQKPSARAHAARKWLALAPPHRADRGRVHAGAALSPDRKRFAFIRGTPERSALVVLDLRSRQIHRLTPWSGKRGLATDPHWALGGRRIVYAGCGPPRVVQPCSLWSIRPDGSDPRNLTEGLETYPHFVVSPNRRWIAFTTAPPGEYSLGLPYPEHFRLRAERIDGSDQRVLARGTVSTPESWSARGLIHFMRFATGQSPYGTPEAVSLSGHLHRVR